MAPAEGVFLALYNIVGQTYLLLLHHQSVELKRVCIKVFYVHISMSFHK